MQALFEQYVPLSPAQRGRISQFCSGVLLAGSSHLPKIARWLGHGTKKPSREQWVRRLLDAAYISQEYVYQPWLRQSLKQYRAACWHVVIDRTALVSRAVDLVMVALAYRRRAIPLSWQQIPYGGAPMQTYLDLLKGCQPLIPAGVSVVLHGDAEFGGMEMLRFARQQGWDFILGQRAHYQCRLAGAQHWCALSELPLSRRQGQYLTAVTLTQEYHYQPVNVFGFLQPTPAGHEAARWYATSLPITPALRLVGRRRWGIEGCFRDYKSSGWQLHTSRLRDALARDRLLVLLSTCYVWVTCLGRWLCKTGQRDLVDTHSPRQLSLFRLGWDWLLFQFRHQQPLPHLLTLYS